MKLELVLDEHEKRQIFEIIKEVIEREAVKKNIQYVSIRPFGESESEVYWFDYGEKKLWISFKEDENEFGFGGGILNSNYIPDMPIILRQSVWIGVSKENYNDKRRQKGGVYAKYSRTSVEEKFVVLHTGKIGGGVKGVGKRCFWKYWKYEKRFVKGIDEPLAFICEYNRNNPTTMIEQLLKFIVRVDRS